MNKSQQTLSNTADIQVVQKPQLVEKTQNPATETLTRGQRLADKLALNLH